MAKRRTVKEPETTPPPKTKTVNARHKIEYNAPVTVPADEITEEEEMILEEVETAEETERKQKRKTARDEREEIRREMESLGVVAAGDLKLMIEKYKHSESAESGTMADKIYCTKYAVTRDHVMNNDYLDVTARWGAGRYWFTLRHKNKIVRQWEREITAPASNGHAIQQNPNDPTSPHVIVQMPESSQAMIPADPFREAERAMGFLKKYQEVLGIAPGAQQQPQRSEDEILAGALLKQPEMVENVVGGLVKRFGKAGGDDEPSWTSVAMRAIETGQAQSIIQTIIREFVAPFKNMWSQPNGTQPQAQGMAEQPQANQTTMQNMPPSEARPEMEAQAQGASDQQQPSAEDQALFIVIDHCARRLPPQVACARVLAFAEALNLDAPEHSIDGYLIMFEDMPTDRVIDFVKTLQNGEQIAALPHARQWTAELQRLIKKARIERGAQQQ